MRVDEFSMQKLREIHATIQELTSQIQDLQEKVNCMKDSINFQDIESLCSGKLSHVPSQLAVIPSPRSMPSRDKRLPLDTWILSETGKRVWQSTSYVRFNADTSSGVLHTTNRSATGSIPVQASTGRPVAIGEERIGSTTPMPMSA